MHIKKLSFTLAMLIPIYGFAGTITIEKSDSLIRNDLFDEKRQRAEEYRRLEEQRREYNQQWSHSIDPACMLLKQHYLIYRCAGGIFYKGYGENEQRQYRQISNEEAKQLNLSP